MSASRRQLALPCPGCGRPVIALTVGEHRAWIACGGGKVLTTAEIRERHIIPLPTMQALHNRLHKLARLGLINQIGRKGHNLTWQRPFTPPATPAPQQEQGQ